MSTVHACRIKRTNFNLLLKIFVSFVLTFTSVSLPSVVICNDSASKDEKVTVSVLLKTDKPVNNFNSVVIPLKRAGRLFLIEAEIDGQNGNLVFDTGASGLVLNRTYFRNYLGITKVSGGGISGTVGEISNVTAGSINVSGLYYDNVQADMADLGHIEDRRGVKILGLFGLSMLNDMEVAFNAADNELRFTKIDKNGNYLSPDITATKYDNISEMVVSHNIMIIKGNIGDKVLSFCLDTGAEINVVHYDLPKKILSTIDIRRQSGMGGSGNGTVKALYGVMNDFRFANHQFAKMDAAIINLTSMSEAYGFNIDGMLGYDFWQQGEFCFNSRKHQISFNIKKGGTK
ncbi:MAG TPA: pepsin/retropepsin-like aspartic protease family protein [Lentimicrobium sp.]|nr:pepsin/retropepsin-like aspartic protease family protein [Lentimicrobium sp.]